MRSALRRLWALGLVLLLLVAGTSTCERRLATSDRPADAYPVLSLEGYHRLLVVAPTATMRPWRPPASSRPPGGAAWRSAWSSPPRATGTSGRRLPGSAVRPGHRTSWPWGRCASLYSFIRQNELFAPADAVIPMGTVDGAIWEDPEEVLGNREGAGGLVRDPVKDNVIRWVAAGADISSLTVFRAGDSLWVGIELRRPPSPTYDYRVYLRAVFPDGTSTAHIGRWGVARRGDWKQYGRFLWYRVDLEELGHPTWLALSTETREGEVLDFTAWYLLSVNLFSPTLKRRADVAKPLRGYSD